MDFGLLWSVIVFDLLVLRKTRGESRLFYEGGMKCKQLKT